MRLFLLVFFLLYGGLHLYAFTKLRAAVAPPFLATALIVLFMLLMTAAPVVVRMAETRGFETFARAAAYAGYTWMGVLFLFCSVSAVLDLYKLLIYGAALVLKKDLAALLPSPKTAFSLPLAIAAAVAVYGHFEARHIRAERVVIRTPKLPKEIGRLTIAQISDVHLGLIVREARLRKILALVREARPDLFISTGDLVDGQLARMNGLAWMLREITAPYGKFAITGNHEFYAGIEQSLAFTREAGFTLLRGESITGIISIAGVDDSAGKSFAGYRHVSERSLLGQLPRDTFRVFLKHRPVLEQESAGLFDLQLSGHTHKGQIFPFSILTYFYYPVHAGLSALPGGGQLYVSRGSGTWGPPLRFLAPPEVTIIEIVAAEE